MHPAGVLRAQRAEFLTALAAQAAVFLHQQWLCHPWASTHPDQCPLCRPLYTGGLRNSIIAGTSRRSHVPAGATRRRGSSAHAAWLLGTSLLLCGRGSICLMLCLYRSRCGGEAAKANLWPRCWQLEQSATSVSPAGACCCSLCHTATAMQPSTPVHVWPRHSALGLMTLCKALLHVRAVTAKQINQAVTADAMSCSPADCVRR